MPRATPTDWCLQGIDRGTGHHTLFTDGDLTVADRYLDPGFINHDPPSASSPMGSTAAP
jgi:hypothetical protein